MPLRIGLTGGIGSGKSTVAAMLAQLGAHVIDTDAIARRLTGASGAAMPSIREAFGNAIAHRDGSLDRDAMRAFAFSDPAAKQRLEGLLHPMIGAEATREAANTTCAVLVFDVPLLTESKSWRQRVARILVVDCSETTQVERVVQRSGWTLEAIDRVISSQASRAARRSIADAVIFNDGVDLEALGNAVETVWRLWEPLSRNPVEQ